MMWITWLAVLLQLSSSAVAARPPDEGDYWWMDEGDIPSPDEGAAPSPDEVFQNSVLEKMRTMLEKMETLMGSKDIFWTSFVLRNNALHC